MSELVYKTHQKGKRSKAFLKILPKMENPALKECLYEAILKLGKNPRYYDGFYQDSCWKGDWRQHICRDANEVFERYFLSWLFVHDDVELLVVLLRAYPSYFDLIIKGERWNILPHYLALCIGDLKLVDLCWRHFTLDKPVELCLLAFFTRSVAEFTADASKPAIIG